MIIPANTRRNADVGDSSSERNIGKQRCHNVVFTQFHNVISRHLYNVTKLRLRNVKILPPHNVTFYYVVATYYKRSYFFRFWSCVNVYILN